MDEFIDPIEIINESRRLQDVNNFKRGSLYFAYSHPLIPLPWVLPQEVFVPHPRYLNSSYFFNALLTSDGNTDVTFESVVSLLAEQIDLTNLFYMQTSVITCSIQKGGDLNHYQPYPVTDNLHFKKELNIELDSGDTVAPFLGGVNFFSEELWDKVGLERRNIISKRCSVTPFKSGYLTMLKKDELTGYPEEIDKIKSLNKACGFGRIHRKKYDSFEFNVTDYRIHTSSPEEIIDAF
jgi:hypothetical protein